ncbi:MAG: Hsp20/alpha crystallin family protein [Spirochaeta sp.]|jgi:HSP20 family protein|nr:Hsp20/alpha crystallin family protein [Spirochaeta sp.]
MNYMTLRRPNNGIATRTNSVNDFDKLFQSVFNAMPGWTDHKPAVDIHATEDDYIVEADLPGFSDDQIDVRVENDLLVISARDEESKEEDADADSYMVRERRMRSFYRSFALPKDADAGKIDATYRNGVLTLTIHKNAEAKPRQIKIKRG